MFKIKAFTLVELIVVMIIMGLLAVMTVPSYTGFVQQGAATAAQNNLVSIYNAQMNFHYSNGIVVGSGSLPYYCTTSTQNTTCANNTTNLNTNLPLNITDSNFSYACTDPISGTDGNNGSSFTCTATNNSDSSFTLTLSNSPIVLPGSSGTHNPSCSYASHPSYCPN